MCAHGYAGTPTASNRGPELTEKAWVEQAERLVVAVTTTTPNAAEFRRDVHTSRTQLRQLMQKRENPVPVEKQQLHKTLILLDALLDAAAKCQTGNVVICPPFLVQGLNAQLKNAQAQLAVIEATTPAPAPKGTVQ
jgi:hypothetical protein